MSATAEPFVFMEDIMYYQHRLSVCVSDASNSSTDGPFTYGCSYSALLWRDTTEPRRLDGTVLRHKCIQRLKNDITRNLIGKAVWVVAITYLLGLL